MSTTHAVGFQFRRRAVILSDEEIRLQRLFSTFPGGWPGVGLLLLRIAVGVTAAAAGALPLAGHGASTFGPVSPGAVLISAIAVACGLLLLVGFLTPSAALLVGLGSAGLTIPGCPALAASLLDAKASSGFVLVMAVAIVLLGPGAFSIDSYLFGRREIVIPHEQAVSDRQEP